MIHLHPKYKPLFYSDSRYFIITGGRGSGKSFGVNVFLNLLTFEKSHKILFTRYTLTSASDSIIPEFQEKIDLMEFSRYFRVNKNTIQNTSTLSDVIFNGIKTSSGNQTAKLKSLTGITTWVLDEAEELQDEETFDKIDLSVRKKGVQNRVIIILNPSTKEHWIYRRFFEQNGVNPGWNGTKNNITYIHTTYKDNVKNLEQSFLDRIEFIKENNPKKYEHQILGGWLDKAEGVVFENWKLGEFEIHSKPIFGQDFGFSVDPTTLVKVSIDKARKKIFVQECFYKTKLTTSQIAELNKKYAGDSLIYGDSAEPRLIDELFNKYGLNIKATEKGAGSITAGIALMQDYELIVDPNSTNLVKELNNYVWNDKKSNTPIDDYNHLTDAIRYVIFNELHAKTETFFF